MNSLGNFDDNNILENLEATLSSTLEDCMKTFEAAIISWDSKVSFKYPRIPLPSPSLSVAEDLKAKEVQLSTNKVSFSHSKANHTDSKERQITPVLIKKPIAKAKEFRLPEIKFDGAVYFDKQESLRISPVKLITEGLLVDRFIHDFEYQVKFANLNIDIHWYDLMETCFKNTRTTCKRLYLWFTKILYEGLSWSKGQTIIRSVFGFSSQDSSKELRNTLIGLKQYSSESLSEYYTRFRLYAFAYHNTETTPNAVCFLVYRFIISCHSKQIQNHFHELLRILFFAKRHANTLTGPDDYYFPNTNSQSHLIGGLCRVPSSWEEFDELMKNSYIDTLTLIETQENQKDESIQNILCNKIAAKNQIKIPSVKFTNDPLDMTFVKKELRKQKSALRRRQYIRAKRNSKTHN